jgi:hypothetical protein
MPRLLPHLLALLVVVPTAWPGVMDDTLDRANQWWEQTREFAGSALERTGRLWSEEQPEEALLWEQLLPRLDQALTLQDRHRSLPQSAWLGEDRASNADQLNALLDETVAILVGNNRYREQVGALEQAMADNRRAIGELKRHRMTAPSDSLWRRTLADIDREITEREQLLAEQQEELARVRGELAAQLGSLGLDIDEGRLEFLLSTVVGDEVVDMVLAFEQVRRLTEQLETLTTESREDVLTARRYYGMYTVLLRILDRMHDNLLAAIDRRYLPQIQRLSNRARELRQETRGLQARVPSRVLAANLEAQELTLAAADRYRDYLKRQRRQVTASKQRLDRDLAVAENTYETVKVSGDLVALMKDSRRLLDTLFTLQVPPLRAFENRQMKREFERLTASLRTAGGP